jgi:hypothetical protein
MAAREGGALAHAFQVCEQTQRDRRSDGDGVAVGDRQGEACALHQARHVAQARQRREARRKAAREFGFGIGQHTAQLGQRARPEQRADKQAVRLQDAPDAGERARKVVDPVQAQRRKRSGRNSPARSRRSSSSASTLPGRARGLPRQRRARVGRDHGAGLATGDRGARTVRRLPRRVRGRVRTAGAYHPGAISRSAITRWRRKP